MITTPLDSIEKQTNRLAQIRYFVEPETQEIYEVLGPNGDWTAVSIRLLEVNPNTPTCEKLIPMHYPASFAVGISYRSVIMEASPEEFAKIQKGEMHLPHDWTLGGLIPKEGR